MIPHGSRGPCFALGALRAPHPWPRSLRGGRENALDLVCASFVTAGEGPVGLKTKGGEENRVNQSQH